MKKMNGIINIYKEKGYTSHDVVNIVRKELNRVKTGHTGTLDPEAEGVLPICIGKATKLAEYITAENKQYTAEVVLGITTDTLDLSGEILRTTSVFKTKHEIEQAVYSFVGDIYQLPPMYSAIKINGKKLYEIARKGIEIEREKRLITIFDIKILEFLSHDRFKISVKCSKGTYIRTLVNDIGEKLCTGATMGHLLREQTGNFYLKDAIKLDKLKCLIKDNKLDEVLIPIDKIFNIRKVVVDANYNKYLYNGNPININALKNIKDIIRDEKVFVYDEDDTLIGMYYLCENLIKPLKMFI